MPTVLMKSEPSPCPQPSATTSPQPIPIEGMTRDGEHLQAACAQPKHPCAFAWLGGAIASRCSLDARTVWIARYTQDVDLKATCPDGVDLRRLAGLKAGDQAVGRRVTQRRRQPEREASAAGDADGGQMW